MSPIKVVVVSGLSGAGKGSILRAFEDLGFDAVDNPPIPIVPTLVARSSRPLAIGVDARSQGFDAAEILRILDALADEPELPPELIYAFAEESVLLRRYTETRRRHPLAPQGRVLDGIQLEARLTRPLLERADWVVDTSDLSLSALRQGIEQRFRHSMGRNVERRTLTVAVMSFAFPAGLPREADMVFDARFLRNPHYVDDLRTKTGLDADVAAYIKADPDFPQFFASILDLCKLVIPRFVTEGKKYATVAIGCTGGRHRSVYIASLLGERLSALLTHPAAANGWSVLVSHRDVAQGAATSTAPRDKEVPVKPSGQAPNESWSV